jgi:hypothetical protein
MSFPELVRLMVDADLERLSQTGIVASSTSTGIPPTTG